MIVEVENQKYEIIKNYKDAFDKEEFVTKYTDYFINYDYIAGDIAYGKLRLKGFYDEKISVNKGEWVLLDGNNPIYSSGFFLPVFCALRL